MTGLGFKQQKGTGFLLCDCGGGSFYINPNGSKDGFITFCCAKCKESCGMIAVDGKKLEIISTDFASLSTYSIILIQNPEMKGC
jgi:hypothetical protein